MESYSLTTTTPEQTKHLGKTLSSYLKPGDILGLEGELGAGKTTFIQGFCEGLGVIEKVLSPTFVLMHAYHGKIPVYHFDLYRLEEKDFEDLGWDDYLSGNGVSLLEWIDRAEKVFHYPHLHIKIEYGKEDHTRLFQFRPVGSYPWLPQFISKSASLVP